MNNASIFETIIVFLSTVLILVIPILFLHKKHKNCGGWSFLQVLEVVNTHNTSVKNVRKFIGEKLSKFLNYLLRLP